MSSITRLAIVLVLAIALSIEVAESRDFSIFAQDSKGPGLTATTGKLCQLCEQYSTEALLYLKQNETQIEILSILHNECASLAPLKQQCITLVDYYVPLFFLEVSMVNPEKFCESVHLCKNGMKISLPTQEVTCGLCHHVLLEVLIMLKDPNTKLEVTDLLLKTCSNAQNYEQQCKQLVLKYIPLILVKGQKFLETTDVCSAIHACKAGTQASMESMPLSATL
ncbi:unnamed protein product [Urochloa decumbens]|uniref:Pulmonary surfactant-associated protein B n=1 Tax=Urochloa decumbens TaxID=240449 RepID=A0ABC8ZDA3_9POAL